MNAEFLAVLEYWEKEKGISKDKLLGAVQEALLSAAKKAVGPARELRVVGKDSSGKIMITGRKAQDIFANAFKVVTERGTVYLMGRVTQREANRATDIARGVSNVKRVVRVFEILTEEELQALLPALRQAGDLSRLPVPRRAIVVGGADKTSLDHVRQRHALGDQIIFELRVLSA